MANSPNVAVPQAANVPPPAQVANAAQPASLEWGPLQSITADLLTVADIGRISPANFHHLNVGCIRGFTAEKTAAITAAQAAQMTPRQFFNIPGNMIRHLTVEAFRRLPAACIAALSAEQAAGLTNDQEIALTVAQFAELPPGIIEKLSTDAFDGMDANKAAAIKPEQADKILPDHFELIPANSIPSLKAGAFAKLDPDCIARLSEDQAKQITAVQANGMTKEQFKKLEPEILSKLQPPAFANLRATECIANLTGEQAKEITGDQAADMSEDQFEALKPAAIEKLTYRVFKRLHPDNCIAHISQGQAQKMTGLQLKAMTAQQFQKFPPDRIPDIPARIFGDFPHGAGISNAQVAQLTGQQVSHMIVTRDGRTNVRAFQDKWKHLLPAAFGHAFGCLSFPDERGQTASTVTKAREVYLYLSHNIVAKGAQCLQPANIVGGYRFLNNGNQLGDHNQGSNWYIEYDVAEEVNGANRGPHRIVVKVPQASALAAVNVRGTLHVPVASNGPISAVWYTYNHYGNGNRNQNRNRNHQESNRPQQAFELKQW